MPRAAAHRVSQALLTAPGRNAAASERLPVTLFAGQLGVGDQRVPHDRLEGLHQRRAQRGGGLDQDRHVG